MRRINGVLLALVLMYGALFIAIANGFGVTERIEQAMPQVLAATSEEYRTGIALVDLVNDTRQQNGLPKLQLSTELTAAANARMTDMVTNQYYSHISPSGSDYSVLLPSSKKYSCENLDLSTSLDPKVIVDDWLSSKSGHRECLLNSRVQYIGVSPTAQFSEGSFLTVLIVAAD